MDNKKLIEDIQKYQLCSHVHPLTCGNDSQHQNLVPFEVDGDVKLKCLDCDYVQGWIPPYVKEIVPHLDEIKKQHDEIFGKKP